MPASLEVLTTCFEGEGKVRWFEGNFADYEAARRAELGDKAFTNRRSKYRRLTID